MMLPGRPDCTGLLGEKKSHFPLSTLAAQPVYHLYTGEASTHELYASVHPLTRLSRHGKTCITAVSKAATGQKKYLNVIRLEKTLLNAQGQHNQCCVS